MTNPRLLYLSFAWPPGVAALYPDWNPAGHSFETQMVAALREHFEIRSVGLLPKEIHSTPENPDPASGIAHNFTVAERKPELWGRYHALGQIKQRYRRWNSERWLPDFVLAYNLTPVYNQFLRWLRRQPRRPRIVLLLLDSSQLGRPLPWSKRLRYRLKPFARPDEQMLPEFDACIGLSTTIEKYWASLRRPFLWMPGGCSPVRAAKADPNASALAGSGPLRFGYFGALAAHAGITELARVFLKTPGDAMLEICGYGKLAGELSEMATRNPRIQFRGLLPKPEDCIRFGQSCDVLVNPRPLSHGNENNFPSKLFEYALCRCAILASRMSGADRVLGEDAFYFEPGNFDANLGRALEQAAVVPGAELAQRGERIFQRVTSEFSWPRQATRIREFIHALP